jgi:hypothetical protein
MASTIPPNLPLVETGFHTNGSLNWVELVAQPLKFTVGVLHRLSTAGVDPYTVVIGQTIAREFPLSKTGRQNVSTALVQLKVRLRGEEPGAHDGHDR